MWRHLFGACVKPSEDARCGQEDAAVGRIAGRRPFGLTEGAHAKPATDVYAHSTGGSSICGPATSSFPYDSMSGSLPLILDTLVPALASRATGYSDDTDFDVGGSQHSSTGYCSCPAATEPRSQGSPSDAAPLAGAASNSAGAVPSRPIAADAGEAWVNPGSAAAPPRPGHSPPLPVQEPGLRGQGSAGRLHVALSASNIRDIAASDPAMRIRQLTPLSFGPGTVVYEGSWQGLLVAVKFMLYRRSEGGDSGGVVAAHRELSSLLATHCIPQRSAVARVYACDVSEVVAQGDLGRQGPDLEQPYGAAPTEGAAAAWPSSSGLSVRPWGDGDLDDSFGSDGSVSFQESAPAVGPLRPGKGKGKEDTAVADSPDAGRRRRGGGGACFHFSSVVYCEHDPAAAAATQGPRAIRVPVTSVSQHATPTSSPRASTTAIPAADSRAASSCGSSSGTCSSAGTGTGPGPGSISSSTTGTTRSRGAGRTSPGRSRGRTLGDCTTLRGLLHFLSARPGDLLLHTVMELSNGGSMWTGLRGGAFDPQGATGPHAAVRSVVQGARAVAQGLAQLHAVGDVHAGLTPSNVLLHHSGDQGGGTGGVSSGGSGGRTLQKRRCLTPRIADCGMRRLVLGSAWREELDSNSELRACAAPELLVLPAGAEVQWMPSHDVYAFGALLFCLCTGSLPNVEPAAPAAPANTGAAAAPQPPSPPIWPAHVFAPLRSLGKACMAADPTARPSAGEVSKALLLLEHRLRSSGRPRLSAGFGFGSGAASPAPHAGTCMGPAAGYGLGSSGRLGVAAMTATGMLVSGTRPVTAVAQFVIAEGSAEGESSTSQSGSNAGEVLAGADAWCGGEGASAPLPLQPAPAAGSIAVLASLP